MQVAAVASTATTVADHAEHCTQCIRFASNGVYNNVFQQNSYNFERMFVIYRFRLLSSVLRETWNIWDKLFVPNGIKHTQTHTHTFQPNFENWTKMLFVCFFSTSFFSRFVCFTHSKSNLKAKNVSSSSRMVFVAHMPSMDGRHGKNVQTNHLLSQWFVLCAAKQLTGTIVADKNRKTNQ